MEQRVENHLRGFRSPDLNLAVPINAASPMSMIAQSASFTIGNYDTSNGMGFGDSYGPGTEWKGYVDERRVSSTARSQGWIVTEYNNQNSPGTFLNSYAGSGL